MRALTIAAVALVVVAVGCGGGAEGDDRAPDDLAEPTPASEARSVATAYIAALGRGDGQRACSLSAPDMYDGLPDGWCEDSFSADTWPKLFDGAEITEVSADQRRASVALTNDRILALERHGQRWRVAEIRLTAEERREQKRQERRARRVAVGIIEDDRQSFTAFCAAAASVSVQRARREFREGYGARNADADHVFSALLARCS